MLDNVFLQNYNRKKFNFPKNLFIKSKNQKNINRKLYLH